MENVTENNKLIAEFMGKRKFDEMGGSWYFPENTIPDLGIYIYDEDLQFHTSWDWLMPVVEKIESMDYGFKMCRKVVEVYNDSTKYVLFKVKKSSRIESTYGAVVWFIKWYNQTK